MTLHSVPQMPVVGDIVECSISNKYWDKFKGRVIEINGEFMKFSGFVGQVSVHSVSKVNGVLV